MPVAAGPHVTPPQLEFVAAYPEMARIRTALTVGDWSTFTAEYARLGSWAGRAEAMYQVMDADGAERLLQEVAGYDRSPLARTALGASLIGAGWRIRTTKRANQVSREQFDALHAHLRHAEQLLIDVTACDPGDAVAWMLRLTTAKGLGLGQAEAQRRFDRLSRTAPHLYQAQVAHLQQLCPKWKGSFEALHQFARDRALAAPEGSLNGALVPEGHIEHWYDLDRDAKARYLHEANPEVRAAAARSVLHPHFRPDYGWVGAHNRFAAFFCLAGDIATAAPHFRAMGELGSTRFWDAFGDPVRQFYRHRALALRKG